MLSWDKKVLHTHTVRGTVLLELQTHRCANRDREILVSILKFKPWVKRKHRIRELELEDERNSHWPISKSCLLPWGYES